MHPALATLVAVPVVLIVIRQCRKPFGFVGRLIVWQMNHTHSSLTDWALSHVEIAPRATILDVGCGGGRTVQKLAVAASEGKVFGVDYSRQSVAAARRTNAPSIADGRVEIQEASVAQLPFADATFDLATAIETHYYWPDLEKNLAEVLRVLKPGGRLVLVAEAYKNGRLGFVQVLVMKPLGGKVLSADEHRDLLERAGFAEIEVREQPGKGWLCVTALRAAR